MTPPTRYRYMPDQNRRTSYEQQLLFQKYKAVVIFNWSIHCDQAVIALGRRGHDPALQSAE